MTQSNVRRFFYFVLIVLSIVVLVGGRSILDIKKIHNENIRIEKSISDLKEINKKLSVEIKLLKFNENYQEKLIREVLGFAKDGEIVYEFN